MPTAASPQLKTTPQRLSTSKDIEFFCVGQLSGRTLVVYMRRKGVSSACRSPPDSSRCRSSGCSSLSPAVSRRTFAREGHSEHSLGKEQSGSGSTKSSSSEPTATMSNSSSTSSLWSAPKASRLWISPSECCPPIVRLSSSLKGGSLPVFDPHKVRDFPLLADLQKKCETAKPLGMFRSTETEFLLCYDAFGIYVDRYEHRCRLTADDVGTGSPTETPGQSNGKAGQRVLLSTPLTSS